MKKIIVLLLLVLLSLPIVVRGTVDMNDIILVFPQENRTEIEASVIEGAIQFFVAKAHADLLFAEHERSAKQAFDYEAAGVYVEKAITAMSKAVDEYGKSLSLAKAAGYLPEVTAQFKSFDYEAHRTAFKMENDTLTRVKAYFLQGDIVGAYNQNVENLSEIQVTLEQIKEGLVKQKLPEIDTFCRLLQQFSKAAMFGNYCTVTATSIFKQYQLEKQ